ncbi:MAG: hypothetical protein SVW77_03375 [Candidatus Nanohaloarchaea archaeon]|nr:hypothetical protein [Candidatus Nanohaloarchaea archaeon]
MNRSGFVYSTFAVFLLGLLLLTATAPKQVKDVSLQADAARVDATFYFLASVVDDIDRGTGIIAKRAFSAVANVAVSTGEPLADAEQATRFAFLNGTVNGSEQFLMKDAAFEDWNDSMVQQAQKSGRDLVITVHTLTVTPLAPATATVNATYGVNLTDPVSNTRFVRNVSRNHTVDLTNLSDPLRAIETGGTYSSGFSACSTEEHARQIAAGSEDFYTDTRNWTSGTSVVRPGNGGVSGIDGKDGKIVVVDDICAYSDAEISSELEDFKGVVSEASGGISGDGSTICGGADSSGFDAYIGGAADATTIGNGSLAVMNEQQLWENNIRTELEAGCYFADGRGPTFFGRAEGRLVRTPQYSQGWASFVFVPDLPSELQDSSRSAVDYVYFNDTAYGPNHRVKGVTNEYSWFRLDQHHIDEWGINALTYD